MSSNKKITLLFIIFALLPISQIPCQETSFSEKTYTFYAEPKTGISYRILGEHLYSKPKLQNQRSYLEWQQPALFSTGIELGFFWNKIQTSASFNYYFPLTYGYMHDLDWAGDIQTNYGFFRNTALQNYDVSLQISYSFNLPKQFTLSPLVEISYSYDSFSADQGIGYYGDHEHSKTGYNVSWDSEDAKKYKLSGITYFRQALYTYIGLQTSCTINNWQFNLSLATTPYSQFYSEDFHSDEKEDNNDMRYYMLILNRNFFGVYKGEISCTYIFSNRLSLSGSLFAAICPPLLGETASASYWNEHDTELMYSYMGKFSGASLKNLAFTLGVIIQY